MQSQKQLLKYLNIFYVEIKSKRNIRQKMRLQTGNEFQQVKIKDLNDKYNVTMFTANVRGGKAFAAEQKIRELKKRISKVKIISDQNKTKILLTTIVKCSTEKMKLKKKSIGNQRFRTEFNFEHIKTLRKTSDRLGGYNRKLYSRRKKNSVKSSILEKKC